MRKFALLLTCTAVALIAGCAGDDPAGPGGTLPTVTGLTLDESASTGVSVVLAWTAVTGAEGYKVWFSTTSGGTWTEVGDVTGTTYTHTASSAGYYTVTAYAGEDTSEGYATAVDDMPNVISTEYSIYDNYAPADWHSGFIFELDGGQTGFASQGSFVQDIYAYDPWTDPGRAALYSGDYGPFGNGNETMMYGLGDGGYSNPGAAPDAGAGWWDNGEVWTGDVIFCELFDGYYAKMYINDVYGPVGGSSNGTGIDFTFEIQPINGLRLFTTNS